MQVSIYRYNPDIDEVPSMREMEVDLPEGKDLMVPVSYTHLTLPTILLV